jgi:hypothetical protein
MSSTKCFDHLLPGLLLATCGRELPRFVLCVEGALDVHARATEVSATVGDHGVAAPAGAELGWREDDGALG